MMNMDAEAAARTLAARRRRATRECKVCGNEFTGIATRRYCSAACRLRASRANKARTEQMGRKPTPEVIARMEAARRRFGRGRLFPDAADIIHYEREQRTAQLLGGNVDVPPIVARLNRLREINAAHGWAAAPDTLELLDQTRNER
jgi:hypothetical protein